MLVVDGIVVGGAYRILILVTSAASVAPSGMPEDSISSMFPIMKGTLEGFLKGQSGRDSPIPVPRVRTVPAVGLGFHSDLDLFDHRGGAGTVNPYKIVRVRLSYFKPSR